MHSTLKELNQSHISRRVSIVDGIEEVLWPGFWFSGVKNDSVPVLTDQDGRRQVNALG